MRTLILSLLGSCCLLLAGISGCSSTVDTTPLVVTFDNIDVRSETVDNAKTLSAVMKVRVVNLNEKTVNIKFTEAEFIDTVSNVSQLRFRPIIPESYGSLSTLQLLSKQKATVEIVAPQGLIPFDVEQHPIVAIRLHIVTTDGYRTEVMSPAVRISSK